MQEISRLTVEVLVYRM